MFYNWDEELDTWYYSIYPLTNEGMYYFLYQFLYPKVANNNR